MIKLNYEEYKDKVHACWIGKSIGGTMGAPYEGLREALSISGFASDGQGPVPNDDLDLQLIWLQAMEFEGPKNINAYTLGEYWLSFITPYWAEYGISKANMEKGLPPHVSGEYGNMWKHSNGAWIRTEIWATLAPASPDIAARYAIEDAKVDHGTGEGTVAAAFVAALESAAFVVSDVRRLIDIALTKIPEESRVAKTVRLVVKCFDGGVSAAETRERILTENADIGDGWFQAPSNVAFVVLGLLYGGGDFKKSMLAAINCGDDTDCTGATIGSIMGILGGSKGIPGDWREHVGDKIVTGSINMGVSWVPVTSCLQLTEKVVNLAQAVLIENNAEVRTVEGRTEAGEEAAERFSLTTAVRDALNELSPCSFSVPFAYATAVVTYDGEPVIRPNEEKKFKIKIKNNVKAHGNRPQNLEIRLFLPDGFDADKKRFGAYLPHWSTLTPDYETENIEITVKAGDCVPPVVRIVVEISARGRYTVGYVPVVFLNYD